MNRVLDSNKISELFGVNSVFFKNSTDLLNQLRTKFKKIYYLSYEKWIKKFLNIYELKNLNHDLFKIHTYFYIFIRTLVTSHNENLIKNIQTSKKLNLIYEEVISKIGFPELFNWGLNEGDLVDLFKEEIKDYAIIKEDLFLSLYQDIINPTARHEKGEYYTPRDLAKRMIDDTYTIGMKVIDCSCGSGVFLIELINFIMDSKIEIKKKIEAINNIYGLDINPIAVFTSNSNIMINLHEFWSDIAKEEPKINIFLFDSLNPIDNLIKEILHQCDLVIGNPPWLTYKDITNKEYQGIIRNLADDLKIKPKSQYITHIELAALFYYQTPKMYLKKGGTIILIITKSILTGDHCYEFRAFKNFSDIEIWDFESYDLFNMDFVVLKAKYSNSQIQVEKKYPIKVKVFDSNLNLSHETEYNSLEIGERGARAIVPIELYEKVKKLSPSHYRIKFFQGATLVPRALIFITIKQIQDSGKTIIIKTDEEAIKRSKKPWNKTFYEEETIESVFHFKTFLSKHLVPFGIKKYKKIFLPVNKELQFEEKYLDKFSHGKAFYYGMNKMYQKLKKETSDINTLIDNLNYWNKLSKQNKNRGYLVVYNASGSNIKSAVINIEKENVIICSEIYYYSTENKEEAYYLASVLNSPILTENIKIIKSSRHIHKRPLDFPILEFDIKNKFHVQLSKLGMDTEEEVKVILKDEENANLFTIREGITKKLDQINNIVQRII